MKIRTGFVSNSSSSSFIMVGAILDITGEQSEEFEYTELDVEYGTDVPGAEGKYMVGKMIAYNIEEDGGGIIDVLAEVRFVQKLFDQHGITETPQLFYGNCAC